VLDRTSDCAIAQESPLVGAVVGWTDASLSVATYAPPRGKPSALFPIRCIGEIRPAQPTRPPGSGQWIIKRGPSVVDPAGSSERRQDRYLACDFFAVDSAAHASRWCSSSLRQ